MHPSNTDSEAMHYGLGTLLLHGWKLDRLQRISDLVSSFQPILLRMKLVLLISPGQLLASSEDTPSTETYSLSEIAPWNPKRMKMTANYTLMSASIRCNKIWSSSRRPHCRYLRFKLNIVLVPMSAVILYDLILSYDPAHAAADHLEISQLTMRPRSFFHSKLERSTVSSSLALEGAAMT